MAEEYELEHHIREKAMAGLAAKFAEDVAAIITSNWLHQYEKLVQANKAAIAARARRARAILKDSWQLGTIWYNTNEILGNIVFHTVFHNHTDSNINNNIQHNISTNIPGLAVRGQARYTQSGSPVPHLSRCETHVAVLCNFISLMKLPNEFLRGKAPQYHSEEAKRNARACHVP